VQRIFITGASSGIGRALAEHYGARGALLGLVARRPQLLHELTACWPDRARAYPLDVTDAGALRVAAADFIDSFGVPDVVIANAGLSVGTLTEDAADLEAVRRVMEVNHFGMAATFSPFIPGMRQAGRGRLVGIASLAGIRGLAGAAAYCASKAAAISHLESLRLELRGSGIRVVTICPGYVRTPMTEVNRFPMPFLLAADEAAARFARVIERGSSYAVVPWQMAVVGKLLRLLPNAVYDRVFAAAPRKPRQTPPS
jgi:short-subunit dehydrogenase